MRRKYEVRIVSVELRRRLLHQVLLDLVNGIVITQQDIHVEEHEDCIITGYCFPLTSALESNNTLRIKIAEHSSFCNLQIIPFTLMARMN